jgi:hypothetical protein
LASRRGSSPSDKPKRPPATTLEGRENQLIALSMDEAERVIRSGKATSQLLTHFLKLGSTREMLERDRLAKENKLLDAKVESLASQKRIEELYADALKAMRIYSGKPADEDDPDPMLRRAKADP